MITASTLSDSEHLGATCGAYTQLEKEHLAIDVVTNQLPPRAAIVVDTTTSLISLVLVGVLIWRGVVNAPSFMHIGQTGGVYETPPAPFAAVIPFGCTLLLIMLLRDFLNKMVEILRLHLGRPPDVLRCTSGN